MKSPADIVCAVLSAGRKSELAEKRTGEVLAALDEAGFAILPRDAESAVPVVLLEIAAERRRQVEAEGWTPDRDDMYEDGSLAMAAAAYAVHAADPRAQLDLSVGRLGRFLQAGWVNLWLLLWPPSWDPAWFKPTTPRRDLVKATALMVADIQRRDRARAKEAAR